MMLVVYALVSLLSSGFSQVEITTTASRGYACLGDHVSYYCNTSGPLANLRWLLNGNTIHFYVRGSNSFTQTHQDSNSVSAFFSNVSVAESFSSELSFLTLPSNSFTVQCLFGGNDDSIHTAVVGNPIPPPLPPFMEYNSSCIRILWNHTSNFTQYYRVLLDGVKVAEVRDTSVVLILPSCDGTIYNLEVVAVDVCGKEAGAMSTIRCEESGIISSNTGQNPIVIETVQPRQENVIHGIVAAVLTLLVLWIVGTSIVYGVYGFFFGKQYEEDCRERRTNKEYRLSYNDARKDTQEKLTSILDIVKKLKKEMESFKKHEE